MAFDAPIPPHPAASLSFSRPSVSSAGPEAFLPLQKAFQSLLAAVQRLPRAQPLTPGEREQLSIFGHFLRVMKIVPDPSLVPIHLLQPLRPAAPRPSQLQGRVLGGLRAALGPQGPGAWQVVCEASSFSGALPVDAMVRQRERRGMMNYSSWKGRTG